MVIMATGNRYTEKDYILKELKKLDKRWYYTPKTQEADKFYITVNLL